MKIIKSKARVISLGEVYTPPFFVEKMLDLLPPECWEVETPILEPSCGDGNFLEAIFRRKVSRIPANASPGYRAALGLKIIASIHAGDICPQNVAEARLRLFSLYRTAFPGAGTESILIALIARRIVVRDFLKDRPAGRFFAVVGNPPYHAPRNNSTVTLYDKFYAIAKKMAPHVLFVIPARWYTGGRGTAGMRADVINDPAVKTILDFPDCRDVFPGTDITGGVCVIHRDASHAGPCLFNGVPVLLSDFDVVVRDTRGFSIIEKVRASGDPVVRPCVTQHFALRTNFSGFVEKGPFLCLSKAGVRAIDCVPRNAADLERWKVVCGKAFDDGLPQKDGLSPVLNHVQVLPAGTVCTESFLVVGMFDEEEEAENFANYISLRFPRYMLKLRKIDRQNSINNFAWVPFPPMDRRWDDAALYSRYGLTEGEVQTIESTIRA